MNHPSKPIAALLAALLLLAPGLPALATDAVPPAGDAAPQAPLFKAEEIDQLVAPIALYPDPLLAQVLMACTYPLEVVEAARWQKANSTLKDKALEDALQKQTWDPSVKSLTAFPPVLTMLNEKLDWTQKLGDAFLAQQSDVMDAVQRLRAKANAAGNLKSNEQQKVIVEQAPVSVQQNVTVEGQAAPPPTVIKIEPAQPEVVYVPTYNPTVVYGAWPAPAYPPYSYYPPGYVATTSLVSFGVGMAVGAALWGGCSWGGNGHNDVNVNVNNYNNFNKANISNGNWQHNAEHRKGAQYRDNATRQKYNKGAAGDAKSREAFRGRAEQGRQDLARGAADDFKGKPGGADRGGRDSATNRGSDRGGRDSATDRGSDRGGRDSASNRGSDRGGRDSATDRGSDRGGRDSATNRGSERAQPQRAQERGSSKSGAGAFQGVGSGQQARADSSRGRTSRESATASRGGGGGGGSHGGGGGGRGGGGGGRGGGGGGRGGGGGGRGGGGRR